MYTVDGRTESFTSAMVIFIMQTLLQLTEERFERDVVISLKKRHDGFTHHFIYQPFLIIFAH
ncbi:hypothetical protein EV102420_09_01500 [Pseudescherichia vulneris NBRC 102420]|uniref:Uncharacterized protein n=1 Tax=Pseudescherichia vulneris NBRC 102420 TaxID=1115515 RepID=A0A090V1Z3_PSEVU|nr:hypothetical protein EV102420_09_01500 [Pseudescherichia vulneris NBRC 102420]STQ59941.1 Uncharacterised protein [Pseudescherichia vulneris]